jgi:hypothetical protein
MGIKGGQEGQESQPWADDPRPQPRAGHAGYACGPWAMNTP